MNKCKISGRLIYLVTGNYICCPTWCWTGRLLRIRPRTPHPQCSHWPLPLPLLYTDNVHLTSWLTPFSPFYFPFSMLFLFSLSFTTEPWDCDCVPHNWSRYPGIVISRPLFDLKLSMCPNYGSVLTARVPIIRSCRPLLLNPRFNSQTPKPPDNSKTQQPDLKILVKGAAMTVEGSVQTTSSNNK